MVDWFERDAQPNFEAFVLPQSNEQLWFLQLGAFQGDGGVWIMENFPNSLLDDVDDFSGADDLSLTMDFEQIERDYHANMDVYIEARRVHLYKQSTYTFLRNQLTRPVYDCIYIDADHSGVATLTNAVLSWELLKPGGFMAFDDYQWCHPTIPTPPGGQPGPAIDAFCEVFAGLIDVLPSAERHPGAGTIQKWVQKR